MWTVHTVVLGELNLVVLHLGSEESPLVESSELSQFCGHRLQTLKTRVTVEDSNGRSGPNPLYGTSSDWWIILPWRLGAVHESPGTEAARKNFRLRALDTAADAGLSLALEVGTTACDPHPLGGDQCGAQRGPSLRNKEEAYSLLWRREEQSIYANIHGRCVGSVEVGHNRHHHLRALGPMELVDNISALLMGKNRQVAKMAKKVVRKLKEEVEKKGLKLSVTENGKERKSKMIASCGFLEEELHQCSKEQGATMADSVETLGVDLRIGEESAK